MEGWGRKMGGGMRTCRERLLATDLKKKRIKIDWFFVK